MDQVARYYLGGQLHCSYVITNSNEKMLSMVWDLAEMGYTVIMEQR